jgi:hypothetical protein
MEGGPARRERDVPGRPAVRRHAVFGDQLKAGPRLATIRAVELHK